MKNVQHEVPSTLVPSRKDKQVEEAVWHCYGAERDVWTESMLIALEKGVRGGRAKGVVEDWITSVGQTTTSRSSGSSLFRMLEWK